MARVGIGTDGAQRTYEADVDVAAASSARSTLWRLLTISQRVGSLGGHLKSGQLWTLQNRPVEVKSPKLVFFTPLPPVVASSPGVWFANCGASSAKTQRRAWNAQTSGGDVCGAK